MTRHITSSEKSSPLRIPGLLETITNNVFDAILLMDTNMNITFWNKGAEKLYGWTEEEAFGQNPVSFLRTEYSEAFIKNLIQKAGEKGELTLETYHYTKDNKRLTVELHLVAVKDEKGGISGYIIIIRDITERKISDEALKKALQRLQFHVENSPLAVVEFNSSYQIIQWSHNAEKIFGWTAREVMGKNIGEFKWVYEEDAARVAELSAKMLASEKTSNVHINRNYRKDGSVIVCEWYNSALVNNDGGLVSVFSLILDITERKKAENELHLTLDALTRSNADLEQFAYVASHDLQEPLRMISTYTTVLERALKGRQDEKTDQYFDIIIESSRRMHSLIQGLLQYSRISSEKEGFHPVDLSVLVPEVIKLLEVSIAESHAQIKMGKMPLIIADPVQMKQLFQNLISNAIKYRGEKDPVIEINAEIKEGIVTISVKDNGIGISQEYYEKIFVIFQRLNDRAAYPGTGIGLSICKRIAENHGGKIWLESLPGSGSTFFFAIPDKLTNSR